MHCLAYEHSKDEKIEKQREEADQSVTFLSISLFLDFDYSEHYVDQGNGDVETKSEYVQREHKLLTFGFVDMWPKWDELFPSEDDLVSNPVFEENSDVNPPVRNLRIDCKCER